MLQGLDDESWQTLLGKFYGGIPGISIQETWSRFFNCNPLKNRARTGVWNNTKLNSPSANHKHEISILSENLAFREPAANDNWSGLQTLLDSLAFDELFDLLWIINDSYRQTGFAFGFCSTNSRPRGVRTGDWRLGLEVTVGLNDKTSRPTGWGYQFLNGPNRLSAALPHLPCFFFRTNHLFLAFVGVDFFFYLLWKGIAVFSNEIADVPFWPYLGA